MNKEQALTAIKSLRDRINDVADPTKDSWRNDVLERLDQASDVIEFPKN